jgi:prophage maintenance system killer protein
VAFASTAIFLRMNGYRLKVNADNGESFLIDRVIGEKASIEVIASWLEKHMKKVE